MCRTYIIIEGGVLSIYHYLTQNHKHSNEIFQPCCNVKAVVKEGAIVNNNAVE